MTDSVFNLQIHKSLVVDNWAISHSVFVPYSDPAKRELLERIVNG